MLENTQKFLDELGRSIAERKFVKLTLGNYKGADEQLQKILVRMIATKKGVRLFLLNRNKTRDTAKNYEIEEGISLIGQALENGFSSGHLFTTEHDLQLDIGRKGGSRLNISKPTFSATPELGHDREKNVLIDPSSPYLKALGITDDNGRIKDRERDKWRQINKFVEILAGLIDKSVLKDKTHLRILDMGSGKGYLTFAAYDYFANTRGLDVSLTGIEIRPDLVELCNGIAAACDFEGLKFLVGSIGDFEVAEVDVLIALHACDTATDDALYKGIKADASLIVAAPCCHKEIRPQIVAPPMFRDILKHGVMLERTAETLTDGIRSLLLERSGYSTKLFEFVPVEHTPKNNMLVGTRSAGRANAGEIDRQIREIKEQFGIRSQRLETLLVNEKLR